MRLELELSGLELECEDRPDLDDDDALKDWIWQHRRDEILGAMKVTRTKVHTQPTEEAGTSPSLKKRYTTESDRVLELLDTISQVQRVFLERESLAEAFGCLLNGLLSMVNSEYGFIGEVKYTDEGDMFLQIHSRASSSIMDEWSPHMKHFFQQHEKEAVNLYNLHSLFGECLLTKKPLLSNDVHSDSRAGGVPPGHPELNRFLGVPFFQQHGEIMGIVGVANRPEGYSEADIKLLGPFVSTCGSIIQSFRQIKRNESFISTLEEKVKERTDKLQSANEDLALANKRVLSASAAQLEHFACMSHEIRTPLNCIIGLSSLLQDSDLNPMQEEAVRMIVSSGDLLLTVVNDVLDYSKLESGNVEIEIQRASLQETLNALVHSISMKAQSKNISLRTLFDIILPEFLRTDSRRVQQILYNLLGNAVKFSNEGSVVDLRVGLSDGTAPEHAYSPSPHSIPQTPNKTDYIRFAVKDYGKGIANTDYQRIFEPFRQATYETEQVYGGTGLGLAITAKLVHGLGGAIYVDSKEGQWSRFTVDLPFNEPANDPIRMGEDLRDVTILFVCNEDAVARQVGGIFGSCNIDHLRFTTSDKMEEKISCQGFLQRGRIYVYLGQEDLFSQFSYDLLSQLASKTVLLTFGPRFEVSQSQGHYRSLVQVIPSVLIKSISSYVAKCGARGARGGLQRQLSFKSASGDNYQDYRILIAEDNKINQKVLVRMLKRLGIEEITVVENGREAVDAEAAEEFDLVFMDMQMPVMDGLEACELITKRTTGHEQATVVFVTAHVSPAFEARCEKAGASGFLPKPFNISDIENCLRSVYGIRDGDERDGLDSDSSVDFDDDFE
uniref:Histidine kinase n=1 Tax=Entomoneis paludosa TaxID=265537 RepID=A0A7S2YGA6_9STRA|mmetsp:Transcript_31963/g.66705  ORF Transcript_31963/g.66705 Transcript_31963/m.66705 type:complete len:839 (+) Transcript_31963:364-2880(+)